MRAYQSGAAISPGTRNTINGHGLLERGIGGNDMRRRGDQPFDLHAKAMEPIYERRTTLGVRTPAKLALDRIDRDNRRRIGASSGLS